MPADRTAQTRTTGRDRAAVPQDDHELAEMLHAVRLGSGEPPGIGGVAIAQRCAALCRLLQVRSPRSELPGRPPLQLLLSI